MKLYATIENEKGKRESMGGNEYLEIDLRVGNQHSYSLTLRYTDELEEYEPTLKGSGWVLVNEEDESMWGVEDNKGKKQKGEYHCEKHAWHCKGEGAYPCPHCS